MVHPGDLVSDWTSLDQVTRSIVQITLFSLWTSNRKFVVYKSKNCIAGRITITMSVLYYFDCASAIVGIHSALWLAGFDR